MVRACLWAYKADQSSSLDTGLLNQCNQPLCLTGPNWCVISLRVAILLFLLRFYHQAGKDVLAEVGKSTTATSFLQDVGEESIHRTNL